LAQASFHSAISLKPDFAGAYYNLGNVLKSQRQFGAAIAAYQTALKIKPDDPRTYNNLGTTFITQRNFQAAIDAFRSALRHDPGYLEAYNNFGMALAAQGLFDQAIDEYRQALKLNPNDAEVRNNLGHALLQTGQLDPAIAELRESIRLRPDLAEAHDNLANALKDQGHVDAAICEFRSAVEFDPKNVTLLSNLIVALHVDPNADAPAIARETARWNQRHAEPLRQFIKPHNNNRNPERRLKIGYVSPDFRMHPVAFFFESLLAAHNHEHVETYCYADLSRPDDVSRRLQNLAHQWRDITGISDQHVTQMIRDDAIDILIDLAGHTAGNRLLVFARRPAPLQVAYLGYPDSTGLTGMDYRFTDAYADPPGQTETFCSEELVRLKNTFLCYRPLDDAPAVGPLPAIENRNISFGCFNVLPKINNKTVECWSQILLRTPGSRMLLKNPSLSDVGARQHVLDMFAASGVNSDRLDLVGNIPSFVEHLKRYNSVDLALDTFPYNGATTTCEALWMGVPVIALAGQMHMSRVGVSLLSNLGLHEWIAQTPQEYVDIAVQSAGDLPRLAELRRTLRSRMQASPLMDAISLARNVEAAYRDMWRKWCTQTKQ
ncbi:MAG TPA: tetratricopeptide repeat protein, partial [Phycisphaerae bacterium]|nr:tetratricopeptide repeat protein [Phycisphaerae bacterium]